MGVRASVARNAERVLGIQPLGRLMRQGMRVGMGDAGRQALAFIEHIESCARADASRARYQSRHGVYHLRVIQNKRKLAVRWEPRMMPSSRKSRPNRSN